ncbi:cysteine proteinase [Atractiella rhizophila]|nr:cysteine proteinase [Atractiella rhizophila]
MTTPSASWTSYPLLTPEQVSSYLTRVSLSSKPEDPSSEYLRALQFSTLTNIPFDTSRMHLKKTIGRDPQDSETPFRWGGGEGVNIDVQHCYRQIVELRRGGYCFANNGLFAAVLRSIGFRVAQVPARVYMLRNKDPKEVGYDWSGMNNHQVLIVSVPGEEGEWLCDVGFGGGGSPYPILLAHDVQSESITDDESFFLLKESLPGADKQFLPYEDAGISWTLYRTFEKGFLEKKDRYSSPLYHFVNLSCTQFDWEIVNYFTSHCPSAYFSHFMSISRLLPSGTRWSLVFDSKRDPEAGEYYSRHGSSGGFENVQKVPMTEGAIWEILSRDFGFLPDL